MKKLFIFFSILFAVTCITASTQRNIYVWKSDGNVSTISSADVDSVSFSIQWLLNITTSSPVNVTTNSFNAMTSVSLNKKVNFSETPEVGVCYSETNKTPTRDDDCKVLGKSFNNYSFSMEFLDASTTYYYRTYVKLLNEVVYGDVCSVTTKARSSADNSCTINGYKFVDLGLPSCLLWAETNVGASTPYEDGDYFAWGETKPKSSYTESNYKYDNSSKYDSTNGKTILDADDDAATANWGVNCRMPSSDEFNDLKEKCTWSWKSNYNGTSGYLVTGPNGNSIFLPASGIRDYSSNELHGTDGNYWSSSIANAYKSASSFYFYANNADLSNGDRYLGYSVRPVAMAIEDNTTTINGHKFIDLGLPSGTLWAETNIGATSAIDYGDYFAWGETSTKKDFSDETYKYGTGFNMTKYNTKDGLTTLEASDDAATANWGAPCRIPTDDEFKELLMPDNCTWEEKVYKIGDDSFGKRYIKDGYTVVYKVTSKKNGNSIYFPASSKTFPGEKGYYMSSSLCQEFIKDAYILLLDYPEPRSSTWRRVWAQSIRPVARKKK